MKTITCTDLEALAIGCALLGSGGGGNPAYDLLIAEHALSVHGPLELISLGEISDHAMVVPMAFIGAPLIATEKLPSGREFRAILEDLQKSGKELILMPAEIGGANGLCAFAIAAEMGLKVLDGDTLGRAFPELQMSSCNVHGIHASPAYLADSLGNLVVVQAQDSVALERIGRHVSISMGSSCAIAIYLMDGKQAKSAVIPGTVTQALKLGKVVLDARKAGQNPVDKLIEMTDGVFLTVGIITEVKQEIKKGFLQGSLKIANDFKEIDLIYQNEFLLAKEQDEIIATTPDILALVESESGTPITSDGVRYGLKVALIAIPSPEIWTTEAGLALVGPSYFGYLTNYKPIQKRGEMCMKYIIGIDIGGTNTDGVLIDDRENIVAFAKVATTENISEGFEKVLKTLMDNSKVEVKEIESVIVGTTHATNAILEQKELFKVGVIRVAGQYPNSPPPCFKWPQGLSDALLSGYATVSGGFECHGGLIRPIDEKEILEKIQILLREGAESIAVVGVFSPLNPEQEILVGELIKMVTNQEFPITLSHKISGVGFLERENSAILNTALKKVMKKGFVQLQTICTQLGLQCPLFVTQNNGSRIDLEEAVELPILTLSAGPTNSFVGASKLCGLDDAIIVDIGGTSTDIGLVKQGNLRRSLNTSNIGGVRLNFPMPDVVSLAIGGGSHIEVDPLKVGPRSVGREITSKAISFGGSQLTLTDLAIIAGQLEIADAKCEYGEISPKEAIAILENVVKTIESSIALITPDNQKLPIILVGGGSALLPEVFLGNSYKIPNHASVANAYGAALSGISGSIDTVVSLKDQTRTLDELKAKAIDVALERGASRETVVIGDIQIIPYHYVPDNMARVIVTANGRK